MDPKPRTLASDAEHRSGRGSLVDENLEFMARLSLIEQALPMLRMSEVREIAEALLDLLVVEARASAGVIWSRSEPTGTLELSAARGDVRVTEERESWPGEPESLGVFDHHDRCVGDIHADLDDRCCHEGVNVAIAETAHDLVTLVAGKPTMQRGE